MQINKKGQIRLFEPIYDSKYFEKNLFDRVGMMSFHLALILFSLFLAGSVHCFDDGGTVIVHTKYGDVMGRQTDRARIFQGIPFGQPPINELR